MSDIEVALDLDSTLAATCEVAFDLICGPIHHYTYEDIDSWSWGFNEFGKATYLNAMWHAWTLRSEHISLLEPNAVRSVERIRSLDSVATVDVVTNHPDHLGITEAKQSWIAENVADDLELKVGGSGYDKTKMGYDVYIDDNPRIVDHAEGSDATVIQYDQPYNRDTEPDRRITTLSSVPAVL